MLIFYMGTCINNIIPEELTTKNSSLEYKYISRGGLNCSGIRVILWKGKKRRWYWFGGRIGKWFIVSPLIAKLVKQISISGEQRGTS